MEKNEKKHRLSSLMVLLFFAGTCAIGCGLWRISVTVAWIYAGVVLLYLSWCVSKVVNSNGKDH